MEFKKTHFSGNVCILIAMALKLKYVSNLWYLRVRFKVAEIYTKWIKRILAEKRWKRSPKALKDFHVCQGLYSRVQSQYKRKFLLIVITEEKKSTHILHIFWLWKFIVDKINEAKKNPLCSFLFFHYWLLWWSE